MRSLARVADLIGSMIRDVRDYPCRASCSDITRCSPTAPRWPLLSARWRDRHSRVDKVAGIEARGFILAAPVALQLGAGFVPVRKEGKLPAASHAQTYQLEYGTATLEVHEDAFAPGDRVLIIDDVLATGGTASATASLIRRSGAEVTAIAVMLELGFLAGRAQLPGLAVRSLLVV
jgi:adenine phosphoribosyltransferase